VFPGSGYGQLAGTNIIRHTTDDILWLRREFPAYPEESAHGA